MATTWQQAAARAQAIARNDPRGFIWCCDGTGCCPHFAGKTGPPGSACCDTGGCYPGPGPACAGPIGQHGTAGLFAADLFAERGRSVAYPYPQTMNAHGLGAVLGYCTSGDCAQGKAAVSLLRSTYSALLNQGAAVGQYGPLVDAIEKNLRDTLPWFETGAPCCAVRTIGEQADALRGRLAAAAGLDPSAVAPLPKDPSEKAVDLISAYGPQIVVGVLVSVAAAYIVGRVTS